MKTQTHGAENLPRTGTLARQAIIAALSTPQLSRAEIIQRRWPHIANNRTHHQHYALMHGMPQAAAVESVDYPASIAAGQLYSGIAQQTLLGRLSVLADVKLRSTFGGYAGGEPLGVIRTPGQPIPLLELEFSQPNLAPIEAAALVVVSKELAEDANAEDGLRDLLLRATTRAADGEFITRALDSAVASGSNADSPFQLRAQVREMVSALIVAGANAGLITLTANPATLVLLATASDGFGNAAFPTVSVTGGTLCGLPLLPSLGIADGTIVAVAGDAVLRAAGRIAIERSEHAQLEFSDAPTGAAPPGSSPSDMTANPVSLFQAGMIALRVRYSFGADFVRSTRAAFVDGITLVGSTG